MQKMQSQVAGLIQKVGRNSSKAPSLRAAVLRTAVCIIYGDPRVHFVHEI